MIRLHRASAGGAWGLLAGLGLAAALPATEQDWPAGRLLGRSRSAGRLYLVKPSAGEMVHRNGRPAGQVLMFFPEAPGQTLTITLPVPAAGYYRIEGTHVYGPWKHGRYGLYRLKADGVALPGQFHGWYASAGPPADWPKARTHLTGVAWGVVYLRPPEVRLEFEPAGDGLLGTEHLSLVPVDADKVKAEDRDRRVPAHAAESPPEGDARREGPGCEIVETGDLKWVVPVPPATVTVDGDLKEWDFRRPAIVANARRIDQERLGWKSPGPEDDADLSAEVQLAWDAEHLYLGARVRDDQVMETADQRQWGSPWSCDSVVLRVVTPVWLTAGPRSTGPVADEYYFGLSYYSAATGPRPLGEGVRYAARRSAGGYDVEAAVSWPVLGFRPLAGDRLPLMVIVSDVDPDKPPDRRFDQYGVPTRGFGTRHMAEARLLSADGWGADLVLDQTVVGPGGTLEFLGTIDVGTRPISLMGVEIVRGDAARVVHRMPCARSLGPGKRYQVHGRLVLPSDLPAGTCTLRLAVEPGR